MLRRGNNKGKSIEVSQIETRLFTVQDLALCHAARYVSAFGGVQAVECCRPRAGRDPSVRQAGTGCVSGNIARCVAGGGGAAVDVTDAEVELVRTVIRKEGGCCSVACR